MNVRKHLAGFSIFSIILGSAILIHHFLNIPDATIPPVIRPEATARTMKEQFQPIPFRVHQVLLDYNRQESYTQLSLFLQPGQPAPEKVWVMTTFSSPASARAESWSIITEVPHPFADGNGGVVVAADKWDLPPLLDKPEAGYFASVYVSSEYQGKVSAPDDYSRAEIPVVIHWPDDKSMAVAGTAQKRSR